MATVTLLSVSVLKMVTLLEDAFFENQVKSMIPFSMRRKTPNDVYTSFRGRLQILVPHQNHCRRFKKYGFLGSIIWRLIHI